MKTLIVGILGLLMSCVPKHRQSCPEGRTLYQGVCVSEDVVDFIKCVANQNMSSKDKLDKAVLKVNWGVGEASTDYLHEVKAQFNERTQLDIISRCENIIRKDPNRPTPITTTLDVKNSTTFGPYKGTYKKIRFEGQWRPGKGNDCRGPEGVNQKGDTKFQYKDFNQWSVVVSFYRDAALTNIIQQVQYSGEPITIIDDAYIFVYLNDEKGLYQDNEQCDWPLQCIIY